ncbi:MAG: SpoIIE family protein phosphatase [Halanaerobiales bacterium]
MNLVVEEFYKSIAKEGEEVCGDNVEVIKQDDTTIIVLSDGLGSGIKANILSTLTSKIAIGLLNKNLPLEEIIATIIETLPVCDVRKIAYATLAVLKIDNKGQVKLIEMDTPSAFLLKDNKVKSIKTKEIEIRNKKLRKADFQIDRSDMIFLVSDGVLHAGIGGLLDFGLGWEGVAEHLKKTADKKKELKYIINKMVGICQAYYFTEPGDDFTILGVKYRKSRELTVLSGPPQNKEDDKKVINKLMNSTGKKVISGGTTAQIAARELDRELETSFEYHDSDIPPTSKIKGIDLVSEGLLTLNKVLDFLRNYKQGELLPERKDGASRLIKLLLKSDKINFLVGRAMNESHQSLNLPLELGIRSQVVDRIANYLKKLNKEVQIEWY